MPQLAPHIFDTLHQMGAGYAFGIPGDFALTLYDALDIRPVPDDLSLAQSRFSDTHLKK